MRVYLPDFDKDVAKRMPRDFLFSIVNKLDSEFFANAIGEIQTRQNANPESKLPPILNVKPELLNILQ